MLHTNSPCVAAGLRRSQLKKRARAAGVDEALIEEAEDGPNAIADIIELIVEAAPADEPANAAAAARRAELLAMKLSALKREARGAGVAADLLDAAVDGENPRAGLIDLILSAAPAPDAADGPLRAELAGMRLSALSKRAEQEGADASAVEDAEDSDDPKLALISLICERVAASPADDRPHFGAGASGTPSPTAAPEEPVAQVSTKHIMLSYQWDDQALVKRAYDLLTALGVHCWMVRLSLLSVLSTAVLILSRGWAGYYGWHGGRHLRQHGGGRVERVVRGLLHVSEVSRELELSSGAAVRKAVWSADSACDGGRERMARKRVVGLADRGLAVDAAARRLELRGERAATAEPDPSDVGGHGGG